MYKLATNDGNNHLHGGIKGFDKVIWDARIINDTTSTLLLTYLSKDGEEGYPGNLKVTIRYTLTNNDALEIEYTATTDKSTYVNLTQHNYYNLSGNLDQNILDHYLQIGVQYDPEKHCYLTKNVNSYFGFINTLSNIYKENKKGTNQNEIDLSPTVAGSGVEPETFGL